jgi:hypothetical protein
MLLLLLLLLPQCVQLARCRWCGTKTRTT